MDAKAIGLKLESMRKEKGVTQMEVGDAVGVTAMAISLYENGDRIPRDDVKIKLAHYYGRSVNSIFFD